jgi:hypothetical protein
MHCGLGLSRNAFDFDFDFDFKVFSASLEYCFRSPTQVSYCVEVHSPTVSQSATSQVS